MVHKLVFKVCLESLTALRFVPFHRICFSSVNNGLSSPGRCPGSPGASSTTV